MSKLFINDVLSQERLEVLEKLKPFLKEFPINGGTGLALHLGHRISFDFDLFGVKPLKPSFATNVFSHVEQSNIELNTPDELTFYSWNNVKITFLYYPFQNLNPYFQEGDIFTGSLEDLIANKFYTVGRRSEIRDYVDIYFLLKKYSLKECIELAEKKYKDVFNIKVLLGQLIYFKDLNFEDTTFAYTKVTSEEFKKFFKDIVYKYTNSGAEDGI